MKIIKKVMILISLVVVITNAQAQPPKPNGQHVSHADNSTHRSTPVGTATLLLTVLGTCYATYKIKNNKKDNEEK